MEHDAIDFICPMCSDITIMETSSNIEPMELPPFTVMSPPSFLWNNTIEGVEFVKRVYCL